MAAMFKVAYVPFWRPVRLAVREKVEFDLTRMRFVGWVWMQQAYMVKNLNHGWVAFLEDQTEDKLKRCPYCKQLTHQPNEQEQR